MFSCILSTSVIFIYHSTTVGSFDCAYQAYALGGLICNFLLNLLKIYWNLRKIRVLYLLIFTNNLFTSNYLCCCYLASRVLMWVIIPSVWGWRNTSELLGKRYYMHSKATEKKGEQMKLSHANTKLCIDLLNLMNCLYEYLFHCKGARRIGK